MSVILSGVKRLVYALSVLYRLTKRIKVKYNTYDIQISFFILDHFLGFSKATAFYYFSVKAVRIVNYNHTIAASNRNCICVKSNLMMHIRVV
jgi:hypothetical protein